MRGALLTLILLLGAPVARAQDQDQDASVADIEARLAGELDLAERLALERARARALEGCGRRSDAARAYRDLLARGVDAASELLRLEGARLEVSFERPLAPRHKLDLVLTGERCGEVELRLYRVDPARIRERAQRPGAALFPLLRAPPAAALSRLARWRAPAPAPDAPVRTRTPNALPAGLYLLVVEARGVARPVSLHVPATAALVRRGAGDGLLWLVERATGRPVPGLALARLDALGRRLGPLGTTGAAADEEGLLRYEGDAPWAMGWRDEGDLVLAPLLPPRAPGAGPARGLWSDRPAARAGEALHLASLAGGRGLRLLTPAGEEWQALPPGRTTLEATLPRWAPAGTWSLVQGEERLPLAVAPAATPEVALEAELVGEPPQLALRATLAGGYPLAGARLSYRADLLPARPEWQPRGPRPLPPHAPRLAPEAAPRALARGELVLDEAGQASVPLPAAGAAGHALLLARATLRDGPLRAEAFAARDLGPARALYLEPERRLARPNQVVALRFLAIDRDGRPLRELPVLLRAGPDGDEGAEPWLERGLRTGADGWGRTTLSLAQRGGVRLDLRAAPVGSQSVSARASLWLSEPELSQPAPALDLLLERREEQRARALALLPFARGAALLTAEAEDLLGTRVLQARDPQVPLELPAPPPPGARFVLHAYHRDAWEQAAVELPVGPAPLEVTVEGGVAALGSELALEVHVGRRSPEGVSPAPARLLASLHPAGAAGWLDRAAEPDPLRLGVRGAEPAGEAAPVASLALTTLGADLRRVTDARGAATVHLAAPPGPGEHWVRVEARDAEGGRGVGWARVLVRAPLRLRLRAPAHLVEEDASELALELESDRPAPLLLSWSASGLAFGAPQVEGAHPRLGEDPGRNTLALAAAERARVRIPVRAQRPGRYPLRFVLARAGEDPASVEATAELVVRVAGLPEERAGAGVVSPERKRARETLEAPRGLVPQTAVLELAADPEPLTALLTGLAALEARPGLLARLEAASVRRLLPALWARRKPALPLPPDPAPWDGLRHALFATGTAQGDHGAETLDLGLALLRLRDLGVRVPAALIAPVGTAARLSAEPQALLARPASASQLAAGLSPDEAVFAAAADPTPEALAQARAGAAALTTTAARAELLGLLVERPRAEDAPLREELLASVLAARHGAGWPDPRDAGAALRALLRLALAEAEAPGVRVEAHRESEPLLKSFSGAGLREWQGVVTRADPQAGTGTRLSLRVWDARRPVPYSWALRGLVRCAPDAPPEQHGLRVERALLPRGRLRPGQRLTLQVDVGDLEGDLPAGLELEVPLPGGCALLTAPADAALEDGVLRLTPRSSRTTVELLAHVPGDYRLLPARARSLRDPARRGTSAAARVRIAGD
ncbi:MAG: hypothetical protein AB7N76_00505 [Planctomycetota bacterium]